MAFALMTTLFANAQWRVGVTAGADYNVFSIDKQYMADVLFDGRWGVTYGVTGQYNFTDWFGVRADFNLTQKNYRMHRVGERSLLSRVSISWTVRRYLLGS